MDGIDTSVPQWLQRNWAPKEPFDPTPWLQERYRRQVEQQKLPLQLQDMALQNQAQELAIAHQGMANDLANQEMQAYQRDLPKLQDFYNRTKGDPVRLFQEPVPQLESLQGQKLLQGNFSAAAQNEYAKNYMANETAKFALASNALKVGQNIPMTQDPVTGKPSFKTEDIAQAYNQGALRDLVGKLFMAQTKSTPVVANAAAMDAAKSALAQAQASGDQGAIAAAQEHLQSLNAFAPGHQMTVFNEKGQPIFQSGPANAGDMTKATQTDQEKHVLNSEQAMNDLMRTSQTISDKTVGMMPSLKSIFLDKLMSNIDPAFADKERIAGRASVDYNMQDMLSQMRQRYGERAVERLQKVLPSTGFLESPANAKQVTDSLISTVAIDTARRQIALGKQPSELVLRALSRTKDEDLEQEALRGSIPARVAIAAIDIRKLPPGKVPPGFEQQAAASGRPLIVSPAAPAAPAPGRITFEQLLELYKTGRLTPGTPVGAPSFPTSPDFGGEE